MFGRPPTTSLRYVRAPHWEAPPSSAKKQLHGLIHVHMPELPAMVLHGFTVLWTAGAGHTAPQQTVAGLFAPVIA